MTPKHLRFIYVFEFLIAVIAIFTAWSEVGGQAALDLMQWGWKFGLGFGLAVTIVGYTAAVVSGESIWTMRTSRWLALTLVLLLGMGIVTYYYYLQEDTGDTNDEQDSVTSYRSEIARPPLPRIFVWERV
jgi:hypothetical protein